MHFFIVIRDNVRQTEHNLAETAGHTLVFGGGELFEEYQRSGSMKGKSNDILNHFLDLLKNQDDFREILETIS